jgi:hypothetical protein
MIFWPRLAVPGCLRATRISRPLLLLLLFVSAGRLYGLPRRLVICVDGIAYRDVAALQQGITYTNRRGRVIHRQAFHRGYFPASRNISSYPSASDVAWTEIMGNRPLAGYQRTYFSSALNTVVAENPVTSTVEHERQMSWQTSNGFLRSIGYVFPIGTFKYESYEVIHHFLASDRDIFYGYIRTTDDVQHMSGDILDVLCRLDSRLEELRARNRERAGRELEILIVSDHGNNHAGPGKRVPVQDFLKRAGYRVTTSLHHTNDVVLPTTGMESWIEVHNMPSETERLLNTLSHMEGVDVLTVAAPDQTNQCIVLNSVGERALIDYEPTRNAYRYTAIKGDPLAYEPVLEALRKKKLLDDAGFATADDWMAETMLHHYPLALERIVRGHTVAALNTATILVSLDNRYVHAGWFVKKGSQVVRSGGTHGALDDLNSTGVLLSNFSPTHDTSANRVAALYDGFKGVREFRAEETGIEWYSTSARMKARVPHSALLKSLGELQGEHLLLRLWTPALAGLQNDAPLEVSISCDLRFGGAPIKHGEPVSENKTTTNLLLECPVGLPEPTGCERAYLLPSNFRLDPEHDYELRARLQRPEKELPLFKMRFRTNPDGQPILY